MKIVVTGVTGFVGRSLVPMLAAEGAELLLVGRDPKRILRLFPDQPACGYDELAERGVGFDLLVHLALATDDTDLSVEAFEEGDARLLPEVVEHAKRAGIPRLVNVSSVHVLNSRAIAPHPDKAFEATQPMTEHEDISSVTVFLPMVYADRWEGKLAILNAFPPSLARALFQPVAALRPTLHISRLADFLLRHRPTQDDRDPILSDGQDSNLVYRFLRRSIDLCFALAVALLLGWALALIWVLVRLQSPGPGLFAQKRIGRNGEEFTCYKFRTMKLGTIEAATDQVSAQAVTGLGRFLRKTKLDELPQIWNILRNEISLVGPRPCLPIQIKLIEARRRRGVLGLKPGISGLAQINGIDMSDPETLAQWDARYLALQSLLLDARIILATATGRGRGDRVAKG